MPPAACPRHGIDPKSATEQIGPLGLEQQIDHVGVAAAHVDDRANVLFDAGELTGSEPANVEHHVEFNSAVGHRPFGLEDLGRCGAITMGKSTNGANGAPEIEQVLGVDEADDGVSNVQVEMTMTSPAFLPLVMNRLVPLRI